MTLRQKIQVSLGAFAASAALIAAGVCLQNSPLAAAGLLVFSASIVTALFWWRCPNCGKGFDPPFRRKKCGRCGMEIDYSARGRKYF